MAAAQTRRRKLVPAVAGLSERVWAKTNSSFGVDDLIDHLHISPLVKVVHQLRALITEKSCVFKLGRTFLG